MTFAEIIANGLDLGGNPGLTGAASASISGGATMFLCALLDHLYRVDDWEFLLATAPLITTTAIAPSGYYYQILSSQLPADYRAVRQLWPVNNLAGTTSSALVQRPLEEVLPQITNDIFNSVTTSTLPTQFCVDEGGGTGTNTFYLYPVPAVPLVFQMRYYRLPSVTTYSSNPNLPVDYPDSWSLVTAVAHYSQQYDKEQLQSMVASQAKMLRDEYRINHRDRGRAGVEQLPFDEATFHRLRQDQTLEWPRPT